jgi:hypothetical protein
MTPEALSWLLDKGIVVALFVITFLYTLYKWIPSVLRFASGIIERINAEHTHQIHVLTQSFERTMKDLTDRFMLKIDAEHVEQQKCHDETARRLTVVQDAINQLKNGR